MNRVTGVTQLPFAQRTARLVAGLLVVTSSLLAGSASSPATVTSADCDPNDYRIAYTREVAPGGGGSPDLWLLDPVTGAQRRVIADIDHGERQVAWSSDGTRLAYLMNGGSYISRTELRTVNVDGTGVTYLTGSNGAPAFQPAWSPDDGQIAYVANPSGYAQLALVAPDGTGATLVAPSPNPQHSPSWSPDGSRLAYLGPDGIQTITTAGTDVASVYSAPGLQYLTWSPDGTRFAFTQSEFNNGYQRAEIYVIGADGSGQVKLTGALPNEAFYQFSRPSWAGADRLVFSSGDLNNRSDLYEMNADGTGLVNLTNSPGINEVDPAWRQTPVAPSICVPEPPPPTAPDAPTNVTATRGDGRDVLIDWDPPASDGGAELLDYTISANGTSVWGVTASETSATISNLPGGTYTFTVRTQNVVGQSPESEPSGSVTVGNPPPPPTNITATPGDGSVTVSWQPNPGSGPGPSQQPDGSPPPQDPDGPVLSYTVTASPGGATITVSASETSATITGLTNGTPYQFTVLATNAAGDGPPSDPTDPVTPGVPGAPTGVVAAAGDATASVSWSPPSFGTATTYRVTASPGGQTVTVAAPDTSATVNGLANGTAYTFTVVATNGAGDGPPSAPAGPVTPQAGAATPQTESESVPGGEAATVQTGTDPTPSDPVTTSISVPATTDGGTVSIAETTPNLTPPAGGYSFAGQQVDITSTVATSPTNPLSITFTLDETAIRAAFGLAPTDPLPAAESIDVTRAEGAGAPAVIAPCTTTGGGGAAIAPDPCVASRTYVGTDFQVTVLTSAASHWNLAVSPVAVAAANSGFAPGDVTVVVGDGAVWSFSGRTHSVTNDQRLGPGQSPLFDSGLRAPGSRYGYAFPAAGTYTYKSSATADGKLKGSVRVPVIVSPPTGTTSTTFTAAWATRSLPGYVFDVEVRFRRAGGAWSGWTSLRQGTTASSGQMTATLGKGTYELRARLRNAASARASDWSPEVAVTVN